MLFIYHSQETEEKLTVSLVSAGYQCYKKRCARGNADSDGEVEGDQEKGKDFAVENNAYEFDKHDSDNEKSRDSDKNTKLWGAAWTETDRVCLRLTDSALTRWSHDDDDDNHNTAEIRDLKFYICTTITQ